MKGKTPKMRVPSKTFCASVIFLLAASAPVLAQGIATGSIDAAGTFGYARVPGETSNNHVALGGSGLYNFNQVVAAGFEYKYTPLGSNTTPYATINGILVTGTTYTEHLQTYGGVVRISCSGSSDVVPYAVFGFGGANLHSLASVGSNGLADGQGGLYYAFGSGLTIFPGPRWGIRPEVRYERQQFHHGGYAGLPQAAFGQNDVQAIVTVFYQFGGRQSQKN
jgi:hypothetical protein